MTNLILSLLGIVVVILAHNSRFLKTTNNYNDELLEPVHKKAKKKLAIKKKRTKKQKAK